MIKQLATLFLVALAVTVSAGEEAKPTTEQVGECRALARHRVGADLKAFMTTCLSRKASETKAVPAGKEAAIGKSGSARLPGESAQDCMARLGGGKKKKGTNQLCGGNGPRFNYGSFSR